MSLRVLHIIPSISPCRGGPSKAVIEMVRALNISGIQSEIATTNDSCQTTLAVETNTLINYDGAPTRFFKRFSSPINSVQEFQYSSGFTSWLKKHIREYDLIHVHAIFSYCSSYAMWLARKNKIPYIVRPIGQLENWSLQQKMLKKKFYLSIIEEKNLLSANRVHFTALSEQEQALKRLPIRSPMVIPLGIESPSLMSNAGYQLRQKHNISSHSKIIVTVSRIHRKKGLELLFNALTKLDNHDYKLLIAGDGDKDYISELKSEADRLGIQQNIQWLGFVEGETKSCLLQGADLFALTSHSENFGISVLEALACGTPALVSTNVALSEQIEKAKLGYVTDLNVESIAENLNQALFELDSGNDMGQRAANFVSENFQWSAIASQLSATYHAVLKT